jgi:putative membrane protein
MVRRSSQANAPPATHVPEHASHHRVLAFDTREEDLLRTILLAGAASLSMTLSAAAQTSAALPTPDFIKAAATTDAFEREEGRLAEVRAANPKVRAFGAMMVRDHTKTTAALKAAIHRAGLPPPGEPQLDSVQRADVATLRALHGAGFDHAYIDQQISAHQAALGVMQAYAARGDNQVLRGAASDTVPIVQHHLAVAQQLHAP